MLPGLSGLEMMVIAAVALIVVGPKDLPLLMRKVGQFIGRLRSMATEFRASFDEMARQSELDELRKEVEAMRRGEPFRAQVDEAQVQQVFDEIDAGLKDSTAGFGQPAWSPDMETGQYVEPDPEPALPEPEPVKKPRARKAATTTAAKRKSAAAAPAKPRKRAAKAKAEATE